ncbi:Tyrosine recombinase XerC [Paenibacillus auburnensis]|uniref:Tyrosine recombinase XerC n=1 Tax=Paenibacillus auburnensis TaxID=2905649 RepID=A0ABN8GPL5_9BACL|nr:tyrosine-type recombinase/integrase [Paenibacillus auburnensis]CAH1208556.1 Tyrosine recombinase XerC [Paenibacillus auburnensis]
MEFDINVTISPEKIAQMYQIDLDDLILLIEGKKKKLEQRLLSSVIDEYLIALKVNKRKSKATIDFYIIILNKFSRFLTSKTHSLYISDLNENLFDEFLNTCTPLKGSKLKAKTQNTYSAIIRNILVFAYTKNYINTDIKNQFQFIKHEVLPKYFPDEVVVSLLNEAKKSKWPFLNFALIYFMLGTGCRISEVANLRVSDFNIYEDLIFIRRGKGQKERFIPLYPEVKKLILDYLSRTGLHQWDIRNHEYLFSKRCYSQREPLSISNIQYMLVQIFDRLDIKGQYTVHSFRHTFAVNALKAGMAIYDLQEILGHENIETTRLYTKRHPVDLKHAVLKYPFPLEKLLNNVLGIGEEDYNDQFLH